MSKSEKLIIQGGTLIDGTGANPLSNATIVIDGSRIRKVGQSSVPVKDNIVDAEDKFILPGLIDCHVHFTTSSRSIRGINASLVQPLPITVLESAKRLETLIDSGFTTIRDCGAIDRIDLALKQAVEMNIIPGPRVLSCGKALAVTGGHCVTYLPEFGNLPLPHSIAREVDGPDEAVKAAREEIKAGADWVKMMHAGTHAFGTRPEKPYGESQFTIKEMREVCEAMHTLGRKVCIHAFSAKSIKSSLLAGIDMIEHGLFMDEEGAKMMRDRGVPLTSLLAIVSLQREHYEKIALEDDRFTFENVKEHLKIAVKAGVKIALGTDSYGEWFGKNALELQYLVELGLTPMQTLMIATKNAAEALSIGAGTVEPGKIADILILEENPLEDITVLQDKRNVSMVIKEGRIMVRH